MSNKGKGGERIDTLPDGVAELLGRGTRVDVGDVIGERYRLIESLGNGAMGQVFVAENTAIGMHVAVKLLKPELLADAQFRRRFDNEARAVASIEHPNVARFFDLVIGDPTFIVMEYVRGETLAEAIKRAGKLPPARAAAIARRLCWGLDAAHAAGVVHRDLKPANVLLAPDAEEGECPKLIDFGLAKLAAAAGDEQLTRTGQIIGTPQYMAPEQITGRDIDGRADVYALGCVLYEMLTGQTPFRGEDVQLLYRQMHEAVPPPSTIVPELPPALDAVLKKALEKKPSERWPSMRAMAAALTLALPESPATRPVGVLGSSGISGVRGDPSGKVLTLARELTTPPPRRSRALVAWAAVTTALLLVAGAAAFLRWQTEAATAHANTLLVVTTQPPGARVTVDGRAQAEATPTAIRGLVPGPHEVAIAKAGYGPVERRVTLGDRDRQALDVVLPPTTRRVDVATLPAGASLFVDGHLVPGNTPTTVQLTVDDFHELRAEKSGYETLVRAVKPEDEAPSVTMELQPERHARGTLVVEADELADVIVDGVPTGLTTPTLPFHVSVGDHVVELRATTGERSAPRKVTVARGQTVRLGMSIARAPLP